MGRCAAGRARGRASAKQLEKPLTATITPQNATLLLIDHQVGKMQLVRNVEAELTKKMALVLARAARILDIPTIFTTNLENGAQGPLIDGLAEIFPDAYKSRIVRDGVVNAWSDPAFRAAVEASGRRHIIMAGVTTDTCLVFSAVAAAREGYKVQAVMDASGSPFALSEDLSRRRMQEAGVVLTATNTLIAELAENWSTPQGKQLNELLFSEVLPPIRRQRRQPLVKRYAPKTKWAAGD